jgi:hypothetical protein
MDIENYVAPKPSTAQKLAGNFGFQIFLVVLVLLIAGSFLISRSETILNTIGMGSTTASKLSKSSSSRFQARPEERSFETDATPEQQQTPADPAAVAGATIPAIPDQALNSDTNVVDADKNMTVRIGIFEMAQEDIQQVYETSRKNQLFMQFTDFSAGMAPLQLKRWGENKNTKTLYTETKTIELNTPLEIRFLAQQDTAFPLGIIIALNLREYRNLSYFGDLELIRLWKTGSDTNPQDDRVSFPADIEMTKETSFFIGGVIPHQNLKIVEEALKSIEIFKGISSPEFKANMTDILIVFEFDHSAPQK